MKYTFYWGLNVYTALSQFYSSKKQKEVFPFDPAVLGVSQSQNEPRQVEISCSRVNPIASYLCSTRHSNRCLQTQQGN